MPISAFLFYRNLFIFNRNETHPLLNHLTADDPEIEQFISLRRLNRNISILIDSDRSAPRKHINRTKQRVRKEFNTGPGHAWITKGREIENYIPPAILEQAVKEVHPSAVSLGSTDEYSRCLHYRTEEGKLVTRVDKVKVALIVVRHPPDFDRLDLRQQLNRLIDFIRDSNDFIEG